MRDLARLDGGPDLEETYERYEGWLRFAYHNRAAFEASTRDLGYDLEELAHEPGDRLS